MRRGLGFLVLLVVALLAIWAGATGRSADMLAALLAPAFLKES